MNAKSEIGITSRAMMTATHSPVPLPRPGSNLWEPSIPTKRTLQLVNSLSERQTDSEQEGSEPSCSEGLDRQERHKQASDDSLKEIFVVSQ
jgi:hypothetical protein